MKQSALVRSVLLGALVSSACLDFEQFSIQGVTGGTLKGLSLCGSSTDVIAAIVGDVCTDEYDRRYCQQAVNCCQAAGYSGQLAQCRAMMRSQCIEDVTSRLQRGQCYDGDISAEKNASCAEATLDVISDCRLLPGFGSAEFRSYREACGNEPLWKGQRLPGAACRDVGDCARQPGFESICDYYTGRDPSVVQEVRDNGGICRTRPLAGVGQPCGALNGPDQLQTGCLVGYSCRNGVCAVPAAARQPCTTANDCETQTCVAGVCAGLEGDPCAADGFPNTVSSAGTTGCALLLQCTSGACRRAALASSQVTCDFEE